jgi:hypothetical protein
MSSERTRVILIFAVVAVIAGGAGFWFIKIYRPGQVRKDAQAEILGWETRWKAARDCLLGNAPASSKTAEALAIRELSPDPWNREGCTPLIGKLTRGDAFDSGIADVEHAWAELDSAATKAAAAFATHITSRELPDDPLPAALDALDAARAKLRAAADLPPPEQNGKPLPLAQIVPIDDAGEPIERIETDSIPSAHGVVQYGRTPSHVVQITLTAGGAPKVARLGPGSRRGVPDGSWGAVPGETELHAGAFDVEGAMASPTTLKGAPSTAVLAALGTLADAVIVSADEKQLSVSHALAPGRTIKITNVGATTDVDGRAAVVWLAPDKKAHAQIVKPGADEPEVELGDMIGGAEMCLTRDRAWLTTVQILAFGGDQPVFHGPVANGFLIGCTADVAVTRDGGSPQRYTICGAECRQSKSPAGNRIATVAVIGGKLIAIAEHGGVLAMWREDGIQTYYALPEQARLVIAHEWPAMAMTDGKVIDVLAKGKKTFEIVRVPATAK